MGYKKDKPYQFIIFRDKSNLFQFKLMSPNGRVLLQSYSGYKRVSSLYSNLSRIISHLNECNFEIINVLHKL